MLYSSWMSKFWVLLHDKYRFLVLEDETPRRHCLHWLQTWSISYGMTGEQNSIHLGWILSPFLYFFPSSLEGWCLDLGWACTEGWTLEQMSLEMGFIYFKLIGYKGFVMYKLDILMEYLISRNYIWKYIYIMSHKYNIMTFILTKYTLYVKLHF